jgi:Holliday junction DNA helicase RuvB
MEERLISPEEKQEETVDVRVSLRPLHLDGFVGQSQLRKNLEIFIKAAKGRSESLDHVLFYGPPGLGKTTLAQIVANELGVGFRSTSGPIISRAGDLAAILTNLQPHDVLFIDEIHRLSSVVEEVLYPAMEDGKLDLIIGEGPSARSVQIDLPPFTLIGATTRSGLITRPLRERFGIPLALSFYESSELAEIILRAATKINFDIGREEAEEIGSRSRGTPRVALRLLKRVRDITSVWETKKIDKAVIGKALSQLEIDQEGFDPSDRRYMKVIADHYQGGPVGIETMAAVLSEQRDVLEEVVEPYLIQKGFIQRTPRGRLLTKTAFDFLGMKPPVSFEGKASMLSEESAVE